MVSGTWGLHWSNYLSKPGKHQGITIFVVKISTFHFIKQMFRTGIKNLSSELSRFLIPQIYINIFRQIQIPHAEKHTEIIHSVLLLNKYLESFLLIWQLVKPSHISSNFFINVWLIYTCPRYSTCVMIIRVLYKLDILKLN